MIDFIHNIWKISFNWVNNNNNRWNTKTKYMHSYISVDNCK